MTPNRVDFVVDLIYGTMIFLAVVLILVVGTTTGVAFGLGALISYLVHVGWKMARFDPQWMTEEVTDSIEETVTEEMTESIEETVTENVERTLSEEVEAIIAQLEAVNERVDRRPRADEIDDLADPPGADGSETQ